MSTVYWKKRINQLECIISRVSPPLKASFHYNFHLIGNNITLRKKLPKLFNWGLDMLSW